MRYCAPMNAQPISANSYLRAEGRRTSPVRNLRPETLSRALEAFENGRLGSAARIFEAILSRDDAICGLNLKRKKSVSRLDFEIVPLEDSPKAREHMRTLRDFYSTLRAKSAAERAQKCSESARRLGELSRAATVEARMRLAKPPAKTGGGESLNPAPKKISPREMADLAARRSEELGEPYSKSFAAIRRQFAFHNPKQKE